MKLFVTIFFILLKIYPIAPMIGGKSCPAGVGTGVVLIDNGRVTQPLSPYCMGALISDRFVLTHGMCCSQSSMVYTRIMMGISKDPFESSNIFYVDSFELIGGSSTSNHKLCLIRVDRTVVFDANTMPYALPSVDNEMGLRDQPYDLMGYGLIDMSSHNIFPDDDYLNLLHNDLMCMVPGYPQHQLRQCEKYAPLPNDKTKLKYKCFGSELGKWRLMPNEDGAPFVGRTNRVLYLIAATNLVQFKHSKYNWTAINFPVYHIDVKSGVPYILQAMTRLSEK